MPVSKPITVATAKTAEIDRLHKRIVRGLDKYLEDPSIIKPHPEFEANWKRRFLGMTVEFFLWSHKPNPRQFMAQRGEGRSSCPVIRLSQEKNAEEVPWVSWRDEWKSRGNDEFSLRSASLTFFWGRSTYLNADSQILRAEWDQLHDEQEESYGSSESGQPHWHIDWPLAVEDLKMSGIHLGMTGWECDRNFPKCWQRRVEDDWSALEHWAVRSLEYARHQLLNFPLAR